MSEQMILIERHGKVGLIRLNRPEVRNALSLEMRYALRDALKELEGDNSVHAMIITGNDEVFAAGADVKAILDWDRNDVVFNADLRCAWIQLGQCRKPVIAAVAGFAFGAGCELAMMCDFIIAADNAKFAQPEIKLGTIPGSGGTQRLTRLIGKSKAMEMVLTGRAMDAKEAERCGLVSRVVAREELLGEALEAAVAIASYSTPIVAMAKHSVNRALETSLAEGLKNEARLFEATFATEDRREGMAAFLERRKPQFINR